MSHLISASAVIEINSHSNQMDHKEINDEEPREKGTRAYHA